MTVQEIIEVHMYCIEILEAMQDIEMRKMRCRENMEDIGSIFTSLLPSYNNRLDTLERCTTRLNQRYLKQLKKIKSEN